MPESHKRPELGGLSALALVGQVGLVMVVCIVAGVVVGLRLDRWAGANGLILIAMILLGIGSGGYGVYRILLKEARWKW